MSIAERLGLSLIARSDETPAPFGLYDEEELRGQFDNVTLGVGAAEDAGSGTLYLTTRRVLWLSTSQRDLGYCLSYPAIVVHAITMESSFRPGQKCLYLQLDPPEEVEEEDLDCCLTIVPDEGSKVEEIFNLLSECSALNPDPEDAVEMEEWDSDKEVGNEAGMHEVAEDFRELLGSNPERFEDPESREEGGSQNGT